jgi:hypothetical protein
MSIMKNGLDGSFDELRFGSRAKRFQRRDEGA